MATLAGFTFSTLRLRSSFRSSSMLLAADTPSCGCFIPGEEGVEEECDGMRGTAGSPRAARPMSTVLYARARGGSLL